MFSWKRGVLAGVLGSLLTGAILVPLGWALMKQQRAQAEEAQRRAEDTAEIARREAAQARDQARRGLVEQAADALTNLGGPEKADAEALRVSSDAVTPEIPQGAYLLIDRKSAAYAVGGYSHVSCRQEHLPRASRVHRQGSRPHDHRPKPRSSTDDSAQRGPGPWRVEHTLRARLTASLWRASTAHAPEARGEVRAKKATRCVPFSSSIRLLSHSRPVCLFAFQQVLRFAQGQIQGKSLVPENALPGLSRL